MTIKGWCRASAMLLLGLGAVGARAADKPSAAAPGADANAAFARLQSLAGTWHGDAGDAELIERAEVSYAVTAGGRAVMETITPGTPHEMISMYYLDGDDLLIAHYCANGHHPRLRYNPAKSHGDTLVFDFAQAANFDPSTDSHIHGGSVDIGADGILREDWTVVAGGKEVAHNRFALTRGQP
ncbi:MAG: hypothetical protein ABI609_11560 [Acidobacteriota bacterium]